VEISRVVAVIDMIPFDIRMQNFLDSLSFMADISRQRAMWETKALGRSSVISLGELYAQFFDDNDLDNFVQEELDTSPLTEKQRDGIRAIRDALNGFSKAPTKEREPVNDAALMYDPEWNKLVVLAQMVLKLFDPSINR
jgi:hypothetical protein